MYVLRLCPAGAGAGAGITHVSVGHEQAVRVEQFVAQLPSQDGGIVAVQHPRARVVAHDHGAHHVPAEPPRPMSSRPSNVIQAGVL